MKCVVLLGFSTTGKSRIVKAFDCDRYKDKLRVLDSDQEISAQHDNHIYNIYMTYSKSNGDTAGAITEIESLEESFLKGLYENATDLPLLLAAGPFLHQRKEWKIFFDRLQPTCFYLEKEPEHILCGLLERHYNHRQDPKLAENPLFGCWDNNVTTEFKDGKWVLLPWDKALENVKKHLDGVKNEYSKSASISRWFDFYLERAEERQ